MKPRISILSQAFKYVPSYGTDIRRTFARVLHQQRMQARLAVKRSENPSIVRLVSANDATAESTSAERLEGGVADPRTTRSRGRARTLAR